MEARTNVKIIDKSGNIIRTITLEELGATGQHYTLQMINYGPIGSKNFELIVQDEEGLADRILLGRIILYGTPLQPDCGGHSNDEALEFFKRLS